MQYYIIFQDTFMFSKAAVITHSIQITINILFVILYSFSNSDQLGCYSLDIMANLQFWFTIIITLSIALVPVIISRKIEILISDSIINNLRNRKYEEDFAKKIYIKKMENMTKCTRQLAKFKKMYNQINECKVENYADRKMKDIVDMYRNNKQSKRNISREDLSKIKQENITGVKHTRKLKKSNSMKTENRKKHLKRLNIKLVKVKKVSNTDANQVVGDLNLNTIINSNVLNNVLQTSPSKEIRDPSEEIINFKKSKLKREGNI